MKGNAVHQHIENIVALWRDWIGSSCSLPENLQNPTQTKKHKMHMAKTKRKKIRVPCREKKALVCHFCERNKCSSGAVRPYCAVSNWSCKDLQMKKGWSPMMSVCLWWLDRHLIPILQSECAFGGESLFLMWHGMDCYTSCQCIQLSCSCYWILAVWQMVVLLHKSTFTLLHNICLGWSDWIYWILELAVNYMQIICFG